MLAEYDSIVSNMAATVGGERRLTNAASQYVADSDHNLQQTVTILYSLTESERERERAACM